MVQWELDVPLPAVPPTHIEENYRSLYALDAGDTPGNDLALRLHPNGLCVVALAPSHAALAASHGSGGSGGEQQAAPDHPAAAQQHGVQPPAAEAAPAAGAAAAPAPGGAGGQQGAGAAGGERQQAAARAADSSAAAQLALAPKLLQAEFRKGRGPLLQADTVLGRLTVGGVTYVLRCCCRGLLVELNSRLEGLQGSALLRALSESYLAIVEPRAAEAAQLAARCLSELQYRQQRGLGGTSAVPATAAVEPGGTAATGPAAVGAEGAVSHGGGGGRSDYAESTAQQG